jgi:hypothetical protein
MKIHPIERNNPERNTLFIIDYRKITHIICMHYNQNDLP